MTKVEYIYNVMKDVTNKTPVLLIGGATFIFKQLYKGNIYQLYNTEDVKDFISMFYNVDYNKPIVIEDISYLYRDTILLKLIEESKIPLILLASEDNCSIQLRSRIKTYIKFPMNLNQECNFISVQEAQQYIDEHQLTGAELDKYIAENCPQLAFIYKDIERRKYKDKLVQILACL